MNDTYHIIDTPLTTSQDFDALKSEGLACIQQYMGNEWTNLNPSDPGITILDELCYALTELGYCNNFSIADILTNPNGKLQIRDQFYLPEEILTSSPVTVNDYRRYIIDGVENVQNVLIVPFTDKAYPRARIYQPYILVNEQLDSGTTVEDILKAAFYYANKCRNLGEIFRMPVALQAKNCYLCGSIEISSEKELDKLVAAIQTAIQHFLLPRVEPVGYETLSADGIDINEIFNGPLLQRGWIPVSALGSKNDSVRIADLVNLIESIPGVITSSGMRFLFEGRLLNNMTASAEELITVDIITSASGNAGTQLKTGWLQFTCKGRQLYYQTGRQQLLTATDGKKANILYGAATRTQTKMPAGKFRDINTYYSIQNTFPEIFRVGANTVEVNASPYEVAQSRQLKGYLTLFDQLLANQFAQLANIGNLFSFRNSLTGAPSERVAYYAVKDAQERKHQEYPVPYLCFSPTYFYQSLYDVPHIRPLLKNNQAFDYSSHIESDKLLEQKSWDDYKLDPYNAYMHGLMRLVEDEKVNVERRNAILDHLLARHGESPLVMDSMINELVYTGDGLKDKVIFKSLYLQNLALLSYYRYKAYNFLAAKRIPVSIEHNIETFGADVPDNDSVDFVFITDKINHAEKLTEQDFINYAGIELKLALLLGSRKVYHDFIITNRNRKDDFVVGEDRLYTMQELQVAAWLIQQRKGLLFIEKSLVMLHADPNENILQGDQPDLEFFFPDFIPALNTEACKNRIELFLQNELPAELTYRCRYINSALFAQMIPAYANWHNCMVFHDKIHLFNKWLVRSANSLAGILTTIDQAAA